MPIIEEKKNRLVKERSPYLIQHVDNPVNWYPWGEEAFKEARNQDKPIFLSIGYSTCHWCHVMAHESFEDREVAELINKVFIPIKVDREERPDIDNVYMRVCQMMTGRGGWPLTIFMAPDKKPFFAATYIPKNSKYGRLGLLELIPVIKDQWENNRNKLINTSNKVIEIIRGEESTGKYNDINENIFEKAYNEIREDFDKNYGGFGYAPKFPMAHQGIFLLNYYTMTGDPESLDMVEKTLQHMKAGGIYDHLGSGYHRYSTDDKWILPHFEKMLYDQALLIYLNTIAYQITEKEIYKKTVEEIIEYLKMKLMSEEGAFYSAEDADSEKEEGKFYLWEIDEIKDILNKEADEVIKLYNIKKEGNYYDESTGENNGRNILYLDQNSNKLLELLERETKYKKERKILYREREKRIQPHKDDKVLTDWNGLIIAALAKAAFIFREKAYLNLAEEAAKFILNNLKKDGLLLHRYREGKAAINGNLDDYCFFIWGLIELYQTTFKLTYLKTSIELTEYILRNFWDEDKGGFFFVSEKENELFIRSKEIYDGAIPSGNSIAIWNLIRLAHLTGKQNLEEKAHEIIKGFSSVVKATPIGYTQFLNGLMGLLYPYYDIIIVGNKEDDLTVKVLDYLRDNYKINISITIIPADIQAKYKNEEYLKSYIENYKQMENKTTVYICKNYTCKLPITDADKAVNILEE